MKHLNSNLLCAVSTNHTEKELIEIAVIPLNSKLGIDKNYMPCNILLKPDFVEDYEGSDLSHACINGLDKFEASELFLNWFDKLELRQFKKIMPLTFDWPTQRAHVLDWLQPIAFEKCFHQQFRDIIPLTLFFNDYMDRKNERWPFPKIKLGYVAATLKVDYTNYLPTVIDECQAIINIYRDLVYRNF